MSTTAQLILVGVVVAGAAVYVLRAAWKSWFGKSSKGCGASCGKCSTEPPQREQDGRFPLPMS
jgi:hypothetical protein